MDTLKPSLRTRRAEPDPPAPHAVLLTETSDPTMLLKPVMLLSLGRAAGLAAALTLLGCGGEGATGAGPVGPPPPAYGERDAVLFDDGVEANALGIEISDTTGKDAKLINERVAAADGVVRARVVTVTSKVEESGTGLQLSFRAVETLAGHKAPKGDFVLYESSQASGAGLLKSASSRLVGLTFIAFVRRFEATGAYARELAENGEGNAILHFHLAKDTQDEQDRVRAASLGSFR